MSNLPWLSTAVVNLTISLRDKGVILFLGSTVAFMCIIKAGALKLVATNVFTTADEDFDVAIIGCGASGIGGQLMLFVNNLIFLSLNLFLQLPVSFINKGSKQLFLKLGIELEEEFIENN